MAAKPLAREPGESFAAFLDRVQAATRQAPSAVAPPLPHAGDVSAAAMAAAVPPPRPALIAESVKAEPPEPPEPVEDEPSGWSRTMDRTVEKIRRGVGKVKHPKILQADVKTPEDRPLPIKPPANFERDVLEDFRQNRVKDEDISCPYFEVFIRRAIIPLATDGRGFFIRSYRALGKMAGQCKDNAGKAVKFMFRRGWLAILTQTYRVEDADGAEADDADDISGAEADGEGLRKGWAYAPNVYQLFGKADAAVTAALPREQRLARMWDLTIARGAALWSHLVATPLGLNARTRDNRRRRSPYPA